MHWNIPKFQTARFVKRWCFPFLIPPQFGILWSVLHIGFWWGGPYGHNKPRYLERFRYLMRSTRIGSSFRQSLSRLCVWHQRWCWFWDSSPRIKSLFRGFQTPAHIRNHSSFLHTTRQRFSLRVPRQTICLNVENISSTPTLTLQILLTTSHETCSRQRAWKYLEHRWARTASFRPL